ncbi:MAG: glutamate-binding protein, partial [Mycolicibacterium sp.]|nr:glutamate-binding protein [Mycolicibacterium sp.]
MSARTVRLLVIAMLALAVPFAATACGGSGTQIVIGTKFDQPGLAVKKPDGTMAGFDVDVATYVAGQLGYK